jgi:diguanylate cyclase (GGDEF)-like protein
MGNGYPTGMQGRRSPTGTVSEFASHLAAARDQLEAAEVDLEGMSAAIAAAEERAKTAETEAARERELRLRIDRARRAEREWARELREQLGHLHRRQGTFASRDDVPGTLLHLARTLIEADKALLLARKDEDHDGRLDLIAHEGFESDPSDSAVAERFAREVLERDRIVREDQPSTAGADATAADQEIENLAAIPIFIHDKFHGVVVTANRSGGFEELDDDVLLSLGDHAGSVLENTRLHGALRRAYLTTIQLFADSLQYKDPLASGEHERLSDIVLAVGKRLDLPPSRREALVFAWLLRDVGKLGVSELILLKPGPLTPEERRTVDLHSVLGAQVVERVSSLASLAPAIRHHHERFDGSGHPAGLAGEQIPLEARIIAVADAFGAMTGNRPYRDAVSGEVALAELARCAGRQFDPAVVSAFTAEVRKRGPDLPPLRREPDPVIDGQRDRDELVLGQGPAGLTDSLTLLYSHRYLYETAETQAQRAPVTRDPFSIVTVELTSLAAINDHHGHASGDRLLVRAARVLERLTAIGGGIPCRYSGKRLAVVMPECAEDELLTLVQQLGAGLSNEDVETRIGAATWQPGDSGRDVVARALQAVNAAT